MEFISFGEAFLGINSSGDFIFLTLQNG